MSLPVRPPMKNLLVITFAFSLTACATGENISSNIQPGMSEAQVEQVLGKPDGFKASGDYTILKYTNRLISGWSWDRTDYSFVFKDDKLTEYGAGAVREKDVGSIHTVVLM